MDTFYKHPDHDAVVVMRMKQGITCLDFLAQGRSQIKKAGNITGYKKRNPQRKYMFEYLLPFIRCEVIAQRHGKGDGTLDRVTTQRLVHKGPFRMQLFVRGPVDLTDLAFEVVEHRPVAFNWPNLEE